MSNRNYTQYSKMSNEESAVAINPIVEETESAIIEPPIEGQTTIPEVVPAIEPAIKPEIRKIGKVFNCEKLNVRMLPNKEAKVVSKIAEGVEVMINEKASTATFYKVCTEHGIEGYCMKQFIKVLP